MVLFLCPIGALAQELGGLARVDAFQSGINDVVGGKVQIDLHLSQGVPYRVYTLDEPRRLVVDFQEVDWSGLTPADFVQSGKIEGLRVGAFRPGWSRMVADLGEPLIVQTVDLAVDSENGQAHLIVILDTAGETAFASASGAPVDARWDLPAPADIPAPAIRPADAPVMVVIDPGHGGVDPGAEKNGAVEKNLMLVLARELREALLTDFKGPKVIVASSECMLNKQRREKPIRNKAIKEGRRVDVPRFGVDADVCTGDHACIRLSGCPSLSLKRLDDPLRDAYVLEVSSPGLDRPLTDLKDFETYVGYLARVELDRLVEGQKRFRGTLAGVDG